MQIPSLAFTLPFAHCCSFWALYYYYYCHYTCDYLGIDWTCSFIYLFGCYICNNTTAVIYLAPCYLYSVSILVVWVVCLILNMFRHLIRREIWYTYIKERAYAHIPAGSWVSLSGEHNDISRYKLPYTPRLLERQLIFWNEYQSEIPRHELPVI